jgi:predicted transposase/invertase (TIGR01784 family)
MRKVNPLNDLVFKKVMGEQGNEIQLKAFLEAVLDRELKSVEIDGAMELTPDIIGNKLSRLDVFAKTDDDVGINIEVQLKDHKNMGKRSIFYWGRTFGNALKSGKDNDYVILPDVITINLLGFDYIEDEPEEEYHNIYHVRNGRSGKILDNCLEIHFIEMPKFLKLKDKDIANNKKHRWLAFLDNNISEETLKELIEMDTAIQQAQKKIEYITNDAASYRQILLREQALLDYQSDLNAYKREGRQEGEQKMINAMRASGMSDKEIEKIIKLSEKK